MHPSSIVAGPVERIIISEAELAPFAAANNPADRAHALLLQQKGAWDLLRKGYDSLQNVRTKAFDFDGFQIKVQFNSGRMTSTVAKVDAASIRERKCFLCAENLPAAQRGIPCDGGYLLLCNPFPIFPEHFTISCLQHTPQRILDSFAAFLDLTGNWARVTRCSTTARNAEPLRRITSTSRPATGRFSRLTPSMPQ